MHNIPYEKKRVILSTNNGATYSFFSPMTSLLWRRNMDYYPIIFACGELDQKANYALDCARDFGAEIQYVKTVAGYTDQNISQISRLFAAALPVSSDSYILTGDIDMWPLSKPYFHQQDMNKKIHLFGANTSNHQKYPICYIGMLADLWRKLIGLDASKSMEENLETVLDKYLGKNPTSDDGWYFDEKFFFSKIKVWEGYPHNCHMIDRPFVNGLLKGRVDRERWTYNGYNSDMIDSHVLRPGFYDNNWPRLLQMLRDLLPKEEVNAIETYKNKWSEL